MPVVDVNERRGGGEGEEEKVEMGTEEGGEGERVRKREGKDEGKCTKEMSEVIWSENKRKYDKIMGGEELSVIVIGR